MEDLEKMLNLEESIRDDSPESNSLSEIVTEVIEPSAPADQPAPTEPAAEETPAETPATESASDIISVCDVIENNVNAYTDLVVLNSSMKTTYTDIDFTNYILYLDNVKKIPCVFDATNLYVKKEDVIGADNNSIVTSIIGRRSGFIIRCGTSHDLVMSKNFIYKCNFDANGNIESVYMYSRAHKSGIPIKHMFTDITPVDNYESAIIFTQEFLKKVPKKLQDKTIEGLRTEVKNQYNAVYDINAVINIIKLRVEIGC